MNKSNGGTPNNINKGWLKVSNNNNNSNSNTPPKKDNDNLSAFFQKQSNKSTNPKTYKKKWCWFQYDSGVLYYHHAGAINTPMTETNGGTVRGYQIKSIPIDATTTIEQSTSIRLEFIIVVNNRKQCTFRGVDEPTIIAWVNGLNGYKSSVQSSQTTPTSSGSVSPTSSPYRTHSRSKSGGNSADNSTWVTSPPSPPNEMVDSSENAFVNLSTPRRQSADAFLRNLMTLENGQQQHRSSYASVKIRQLLLRHQPPLENDQTSYILTQIHQQISYLQECYNEVLFVSNGSLGSNNGNQQPSSINTRYQENGQYHTSNGYPSTSPPSHIQPSSSPSSSNYQHQQHQYQQILNITTTDYDDDVAATLASANSSGIFSILPPHLSIYIFSFLTPSDLLVCCQVSYEWIPLASDNSLWLRFTQHLATPASIFDPTQNWKRTYLNHRKQSMLGKKEKIMNRTISLYGIPATTSNTTPIKEGYLYKRGEDILKIWKKRYFVLKDNCLFYFQHSQDNFPNGMIPLNNSIKLIRVPNSTRKHCFKIIHNGLQSGKQGGVERREPYFLSSDNDDDCNEWMKSIQKIVASGQLLEQSHLQQPPSNVQQTTTTTVGASGKAPAPLPSTIKKGSSKKSPPTASNSASTSTSPPTSQNLVQPELPIVPIKPLFGLTLAHIMGEQAKCSVTMGSELPMPFILYRCLTHIQENGINEEGIFRMSGSMVEIEQLKNAFELGRDVDLSLSDIHAITGLVKLFFRKLPHHLVPSDLDHYATSVSLAQSQTIEEKIQEYKFIFESLPAVSYAIMKQILLVVKLVVDNKHINKMSEENMLIVIMPTLNCSPVLVTNGIRYYDQIFDQQQ